MAALPSAYISHAMDQATRDLWYADYGKRVAVVFETVTHVYEVATKTNVSGNQLLVNRSIVPGVAPADTVPAQPTVTIVPAIQHHPAAQIGKARLEAKLASPKASAAGKTWDELDDQERDAVMRSLAERMGLVQKPK
jgi:hypothetical protein